MSTNRRDFMKLAGLVAATGLAGKGATQAFSQARLPQESPMAGKRWAMVVDMRKCVAQIDCHECSKACHATHNVPDFDNTKYEVKWIWKETFDHSLHECAHSYQCTCADCAERSGHALHENAHGHGSNESAHHASGVLCQCCSKIPVLCNHCDNPPCVRVCPTRATWRREKDGIVMMDWHRCIGCRYCVMACPYGSRSFNWQEPRPGIKQINPNFPTREKGVVEKCTFCEERLAAGLGPACVDACKAKALIFGDLDDPNSEVRAVLQARFSVQRKPELGTRPQVYYIV